MCFKKKKKKKKKKHPPNKNCTLSKNILHPHSSFFLVIVFAVLHSMWVSVPQPGIKPGPYALESQSLKHWTAREALSHSFLKEKNVQTKKKKKEKRN